MDLGTLVQKVYDLIAAARNGDWMASISLCLQIIQAISSVLPVASLNKPRGGMKAVDLSAKTMDELIQDLEDCCKQVAPPQGATPAKSVAPAAAAAMKAAPSGPFIDSLLPILLAMLKKWLGF